MNSRPWWLLPVRETALHHQLKERQVTQPKHEYQDAYLASIMC